MFPAESVVAADDWKVGSRRRSADTSVPTAIRMAPRAEPPSACCAESMNTDAAEAVTRRTATVRRRCEVEELEGGHDATGLRNSILRMRSGYSSPPCEMLCGQGDSTTA